MADTDAPVARIEKGYRGGIALKSVTHVPGQLYYLSFRLFTEVMQLDESDTRATSLGDCTFEVR